jgi:hypothetical protein
MRADLEQKQTQREQVVEEQRLRKLRQNGVVPIELGDMDADQEVDDGDDTGMEEVVETPG